MGLLLYLVGLLALISGVHKLRKRIRAGSAASATAIAEVAVGAGVVLASAAGVSRTPAAPWVVAAALVVVLVSLYTQVRRAVLIRNQQLESEAERLEQHVKRTS
jgi:uncharacterized membrane protein YjfL (UPF0719 family)